MSNKEKINCDEGRKWNCSLRLMLSEFRGARQIQRNDLLRVPGGKFLL